MIEINLVPDVKQELIKAQRARATVITASILIGLISIAVVLLLAAYIFLIQGIISNRYDDDIAEYNKEFSSVEDLSKILTVQNQLDKMSSLNENKNITSRVFDVLTTIIPPSPNEVQISLLKIDTSTNKVTIEGQASNSYAALDVFRKTLGNAYVNYTDGDGNKQTTELANDISTSNASYGEDASGVKVLRFTLTFAYADELFALSSKDATVTIKGEDNATDSYRVIPIFADKAKDLTEEQ